MLYTFIFISGFIGTTSVLYIRKIYQSFILTQVGVNELRRIKVWHWDLWVAGSQLQLLCCVVHRNSRSIFYSLVADQLSSDITNPQTHRATPHMCGRHLWSLDWKDNAFKIDQYFNTNTISNYLGHCCNHTWPVYLNGLATQMCSGRLSEKSSLYEWKIVPVAVAKVLNKTKNT